MAVVAAKGTIQRLIARGYLAVGMFGMVRANNRQPALSVDARQHHAVAVHPLKNAILARVAQTERDPLRRVGVGRRHVKRFANLRQRELTVRMELDQARRERIATGLQID